jgi:hypothetical protein
VSNAAEAEAEALDRPSLCAGPTVSTQQDFYDDMRNFLEIIQDCPPPMFHKYLGDFNSPQKLSPIAKNFRLERGTVP